MINGRGIRKTKVFAHNLFPMGLGGKGKVPDFHWGSGVRFRCLNSAPAGFPLYSTYIYSTDVKESLPVISQNICKGGINPILQTQNHFFWIQTWKRHVILRGKMDSKVSHKTHTIFHLSFIYILYSNWIWQSMFFHLNLRFPLCNFHFAISVCNLHAGLW